MTTRRRRGEYPTAPTRRQQIVSAGLAVFSSSGFHGGSLRDIAERAGISQAGLLHHFPSKKHLLQAVLTWRDDEARRQLGEPFPDGLDLIRRLVARPVAPPARELVQLHVKVSAEGVSVNHPIHGYVFERHASAFRTVRQAFERAVADGELRNDVDCAAAARTLLALTDGLQVQWLLHPDEADVEGDLRRCLESLLAADLQAPAGRALALPWPERKPTER
jgi:AcrR family transcriptional regulator